jgi:hypothetical protein
VAVKNGTNDELNISHNQPVAEVDNFEGNKSMAFR